MTGIQDSQGGSIIYLSLRLDYKIHRELADFDRRTSAPVAGPMLVLLLLGWTVIAPLVGYYNTGNRIKNAQRAAGVEPTCSAAVGLLLAS
ncbi:hypothetical protein [Rhodococcus sp. H29-C3]|uniref:hypothetical protein n=1 Tax=Rhodococcus sp. H29-C3 TaxID=3046307 RepID=UPI0024BB4F86|nr:hypothetical protein [Rhodococcus sp. H29-C3]MDJ0362705.1 hypothetical protein [Rhodococcus sp. H29-C3]